MNRYKVTIKRIGLALVWLANVATILGWTYIAVYHLGGK
jgi:hypothetical protein